MQVQASITTAMEYLDWVFGPACEHVDTYNMAHDLRELYGTWDFMDRAPIEYIRSLRSRYAI